MNIKFLLTQIFVLSNGFPPLSKIGRGGSASLHSLRGFSNYSVVLDWGSVKYWRKEKRSWIVRKLKGKLDNNRRYGLPPQIQNTKMIRMYLLILTIKLVDNRWAKKNFSKVHHLLIRKDLYFRLVTDCVNENNTCRLKFYDNDKSYSPHIFYWQILKKLKVTRLPRRKKRCWARNQGFDSKLKSFWKYHDVKLTMGGSLRASCA